MKATIYIVLAIGTAAIIAYLIKEGRKEPVIAAVENFAADDDRVYNAMRDELMAYMQSRGYIYGAWFDENVQKHFETGATIAGQPSKAAAFMKEFAIHAYHDAYKGKVRWFNQLLKNLQNRYK